MSTPVDEVVVAGADHPTVLTPDALSFVATLEREFGQRRRELLQARSERQQRVDAGEPLGFLPETEDVRSGDWRVWDEPPALANRRVEITGPTDAKMVINALNSGATGFMADFEDSNTPTWDNLMQGQANLSAAVRGTLTLSSPPSTSSPQGKEYRLDEKVATLLVRPRGWHLSDRHLLVDSQEISGSLLDAGLFLFHNGRFLAERGDGPFFYLPKMESYLEARLWNDVLTFAEAQLGVPHGTSKATVLIETFPAAFQMDEILHELREHSAGLNAGRWDYLFSAIKTFRNHPEQVMPDRSTVTMAAPFMRAYTELLVKTCHRRGAHAMGGMAAFIPSRRDAELNERALAKVREDKRREATAGFDGTWVAHPDLVVTALEEFDAVLGERPNQVDRQRDDVHVTAADLLDLASAGSSCTEDGLRDAIGVSLQYLSAWLSGSGAVGINNLMEDVATAEISRAQVWQWVNHGVHLDDGRPVTADLVRSLAAEELAVLKEQIGDEAYQASRAQDALEVFEEVSLSEQLPDFLTVPAYERLD